MRLFHAREAVSAAVLRRTRMFRSEISRRGAERQSRGAFGRAGAPRTPQKGAPTGMKKSLIAIVAVLLVGAGMAKRAVAANNGRAQTPAAPQTEQPENGRARSPSAPQTGNLSKLRRDKLIGKIGEIKSFLEKSSDTNAVRLLRFAAEVEREVRGKKFGLVFEEHRENIDLMLEENLPVLTEVKKRYLAAKNAKDDSPLNFLIEGDNLAALKLLEKTHRGKIDLIYIDPPYNTGNKDFIYNDSYVDKTDTFRHSKWLSFMKKRLQIARCLMSENGVIFISIDDNEQAQLKLLCDEIFGGENFVAEFPRLATKSGKTPLTYMVSHDYVICYVKHDKNIFCGIPFEDASYKYEDEFVKERGRYNLKQPLDCNSISYSASLDYIIEHEGQLYYPGGSKEKYEERKRGNHKAKDYAWRWSRDLYEFGLRNGWVVFKNNRIYTKGYLQVVIEKIDGHYQIIKKEKERKLSTIDFIDNVFSNDIAKKQLANVGVLDKFDFPKPLDLLINLMQTYQNESPLVLDFFAGSGTTGHAVMKLNAEDGGKRKFILVTNNENGICEKVTYERMKRVIERDKYAASLKYFKVDYIPIDGKVYYDYADDLLKHIRELVELENAIDFRTDSTIAIAVTDKEFEKFVANDKNMEGKRALYVGHDVLIGKSARQKLERRGIEIRIIPQYYYSEQEA